MQIVQEDARRTLWPTQIDFTNAFNRISRSAVLANTTSHFPSIGLGDPVLREPITSPLYHIHPLRPLLFAIAIHSLAQELRSGPLDLAFFYLDDGVIGDVAAVGQALAHIQTKEADLGLSLNLSKCEVVDLGPTPPPTLAQHLPWDLLQHPDGRSRLQQNFELLGAAIGDDSFVSAHTQGRVQAAGPGCGGSHWGCSSGASPFAHFALGMAASCIACAAHRHPATKSPSNRSTPWCSGVF